MDPGTRACIAYIAGCVISRTTPPQVFDKDRNLNIRMKGRIKGQVVEVFEYERNCKFMGTLPTLFDYGTNTPILLEISGKTFSGSDRHAEHYFVGTVEGRDVKLHDYGEARDFFYQLRDIGSSA